MSIFFEYMCVNPKCDDYRNGFHSGDRVDMVCEHCGDPMRRVVREGEDE